MEEVRRPTMGHLKGGHGDPGVCGNESPVAFRKINGKWRPIEWDAAKWSHAFSSGGSTMVCMICGGDFTKLR
jgi:hypothetical protein